MENPMKCCLNVKKFLRGEKWSLWAEQLSCCIRYIVPSISSIVKGILRETILSLVHLECLTQCWHTASAQYVLNKFSQDFPARALLPPTLPLHAAQNLRVVENGQM